MDHIQTMCHRFLLQNLKQYQKSKWRYIAAIPKCCWLPDYSTKSLNTYENDVFFIHLFFVSRISIILIHNFFYPPSLGFIWLDWLHCQLLIFLSLVMIFKTQTNTGAMVKRVDIGSYNSREPFSPLLRVCHVNVSWRCFRFLISVNNFFESKNVKWQRTGTLTTT